ncbi:hypothetical protein [Xenorhabdus miraniensis]|uniref:Uncharacterized protein n=1 Tax=Xenorhabdus miraniensis TaxID=351674 RepID=A0A2D0JQ15_9GAMM|nr:hypothetical protein [Xenorhabdus miraniensis]PHM48374.1 hypothetical protein Xmir_02451 [Xenorhabdus miraniensis]
MARRKQKNALSIVVMVTGKSFYWQSYQFYHSITILLLYFQHLGVVGRTAFCPERKLTCMFTNQPKTIG